MKKDRYVKSKYQPMPQCAPTLRASRLQMLPGKKYGRTHLTANFFNYFCECSLAWWSNMHCRHPRSSQPGYPHKIVRLSCSVEHLYFSLASLYRHVSASLGLATPSVGAPSWSIFLLRCHSARRMRCDSRHFCRFCPLIQARLWPPPLAGGRRSPPRRRYQIPVQHTLFA